MKTPHSAKTLYSPFCSSRLLSRTSLRRTAFLALTLLLFGPAAFSSQQARAQWATIDVTNAIAMGKQFIQIRNQILTLRDQYRAMQRDLREFEDMTNWNGQDWIDQVEGAQDRLDAVSYVMEDIDEQLGDLYGTGAYEDYIEDNHEQLQRTLSTMRTAINTMRTHRLQIEDGISEITRLKEDNQSADGNRQALQTQTNAMIYQIESLQMLREQMSTMTTMMGVQNSQRLSERMQQEETAREVNQDLIEQDRPELRSRWEH